MAFIVDPLGTYVVVSSTVLLLAAKDFVILQLWNVFGKSTESVPRTGVATSPNEKKDCGRTSTRSKRLITCKEISDLVFSVFLALITLYVLVATPALSCAFVVTGVDVLDLVDVLMAVQVGRTFFRAFFHCFVRFNPVLLVHCTILSLCYLSFLCPGASTAIGLIGVVCDGADVHHHVGKLLDVWKVPSYAKGRLWSHAIGLGATLVGRCCLPLALLVLALCQGNPIQMSDAALALFFFFLTYLAAINIFLVVTAAAAFREATQLRQLYQSARRDSGKTLQFAIAMKNANVRYLRPDCRYQKDQTVVSIT